jgi:hypothetical protein
MNFLPHCKLYSLQYEDQLGNAVLRNNGSLLSEESYPTVHKH